MHTLIGLDFRTLSFVTLLFSFIFGSGLIVFAYKHQRFHGITLIGWGFLILGIGYVLLGLRGVISDFLSIVIANSLIYISLLMTYRGLFRFLGGSMPGEKYLSSAGLGFLVSVLYYFTYYSYDVNARIIGFSCSYAWLCLMTAYGLLRSDRRFAPLPIRFLIATFLGVGLFHVYRVVWTSNAAPLLNFMDAGVIHAVTVLTSQFIVLFVTFMVIWIASDSLEQELKAMVEIDPLTGIKNRRALENFCEIEFARSMRSGRPFSLVICDIDHFKSFNDKYGHQTGDRVLVEFSRLLKRHVREVDLIARYGGEEFVVVLPETNCQQAEEVAEKLRKLVMEYKIQHQKMVQPLSVTSSFGVASLPPNYLSWEAMFKAADKALYAAKKHGRNCVVVAQPDTRAGSPSAV